MRRLQILTGQHPAFFDGGLVERVDAKEMGRDDRLQHELHQQFAEALLVEMIDVERSDRAAVAREGFGGSAALGGNKIAHGLAGEIRLAHKLGKIGGDARAAAGGPRGQDGEQLVARARDIELELAVLVDRPDCANRRCAFAVLAEAFGPELNISAGEAFELVRIGHHDGDRFADRDRQSGADGRGHLGRRVA